MGNSNFTWRYFQFLWGSVIHHIKPIHIIVSTIPGITLIYGFYGFSPIRLVIGAAIGIAFMFALLFAWTLIVVYQNAGLYKILDERGFCEEYRNAYAQKRIVDKPFIKDYALGYAEALMNSGKPGEAIMFLNTLTIPENTNIYFKARSFFVYMMSALKIGNLAIAEDKWNKNSALINGLLADPKNARYSYLTIIPMIYTDCLAARQNGDKSRLERALKQTEDFISSPAHKEYKVNTGGGFAFEIARLYELHELGIMDRYNELLPAVRSKIENSERLFTCLKTMELEDLAQIENGEFPL